eukprot:TRINITY_DN21398_c0_g1_i1.p1 TRINITY_DN21398_c0_g1~~TRINITY_DN21398_c0_g1_i1.p1  ORF type:complete len:136 (+),score=30.35 TRINITY_DN21398_c0_g1_i1:114-521(+)
MKKRSGFRVPYQQKRLKEDDADNEAEKETKPTLPATDLLDDFDIEVDAAPEGQIEKEEPPTQECNTQASTTYSVYFAKISSKKHKAWESGSLHHADNIVRLINEDDEEIDRCFRNKVCAGDEFELSCFMVEVIGK